MRSDRQVPSLRDWIDIQFTQGKLWSKLERKRRLIELLASFNPMYESHYVARAGRGETGLLSPQELDRWQDAEWPDPRW